MPKRKSVDHANMRAMNMALILDHLRLHAPLSRSNIAATTGLNKATVSSIVRQLIDKGLILELGIRSDVVEIGHPSIDLEINTDGGRIIGAEIKPDLMTVIVSNFGAETLWRRDEIFSRRQDKKTLLDRLLALLEEAFRQASDSTPSVVGIAVGVPGLVNIKTGTISFDPVLGMTGVPLREIISQRFPNLPVFTGNEAIISALGESFYGKAHDYEHVLYISSGMTMGGGVILNGNILPGTSGLGGGIGHLQVGSQNPCDHCSNLGCWETVASQKALFRYIQEAVHSGQFSELTEAVQTNDLSIELIVQAADNHDVVALQALEKTGNWLGVGTANLINVLNPNLVVLGGALMAAHNHLLPAVRKSIAERKLPWLPDIEVKVASHGDNACITGTVATVFWEMLNNPEFLP